MKGFILVITMIGSFILCSFSKNNKNTETSYASYYHDKFNGKKTASGEIFHNSKLTAAHRTLPFGTRLLVRNLKNGNEVEVVVNDRGPFHASRALDLSKAAFAALEDIRSGKVAIEYTIIEDEPTPTIEETE